MNRYVILLRGINVGGKNTVSMARLKLCLEEQGFVKVKTYINSGNVVLESDRSAIQIAANIETMLPMKFELHSELIRVLVLSHDQLKKVIDQAPAGFGTGPTTYYCDAIFLIGMAPEEAMKVFAPREGVDTIWSGKGVIYSQRLAAERTKSRLGKIMGTPAYKNMTIRNWKTTTKLLALLDEMTLSSV